MCFVGGRICYDYLFIFPADLTDVEDGNAAALTDGVDANVDDTPKVGD